MLAQQLVNGCVVGSIYALFALGFTLIFGVLGVINLVYGVYFSAGAFIALFASQMWGMPIALAVALAAVVTGGAAVAIDGALLTPLRRARAPELSSLMVTLGATLFFYSAANAIFGSDIRRFPAGVFSTSMIGLGPARISASQILVVVAALAVVAGLLVLMRATRTGLAIRALAEDAETTQLMGANSAALASLVSFLSAALGAIAGALVGLNSDAIQPYMGESTMLKGFAVIVLGGIGDIRGALVAGLLIGILETLVAGYISSTWKDAVGFILLTLTLWTRPHGLFGRPTAKRA